jgi:hypothetical protein
MLILIGDSWSGFEKYSGQKVSAGGSKQEPDGEHKGRHIIGYLTSGHGRPCYSLSTLGREEGFAQRPALSAGGCYARRSDDTEAIWSEASDVPSISSSCTSLQQLGSGGG